MTMNQIWMRRFFLILSVVLVSTPQQFGVCQQGADAEIESKILRGHTRAVQSVSWSPDGQMLASGSYDETVRVWDVNSGKALKALNGHTNWVNSVSFSLDGQLASGSNDNTIRVWDVNSGKALKILKGHTSWVQSVSWSRKGLLASGSNDETVRVWDVSSGRTLKTLKGHTWYVDSVSFSPDGQLLASGDDDGTASVWDVNSGKALKIHLVRAPVSDMSWSPDGQLIAIGGGLNIPVWDVSNSRSLKILRGASGFIFVHSVSWSRDGRLASGRRDGTVSVWDVNSGKELKVLKGHTGAVQSVSFSPDGQLLASGSDDKTVRVWDVTGIVPPGKSPDPPTNPADADGDDGGTPGDTVSKGDPAPFLREPNLPVGYGYTDIALDNQDHLNLLTIPWDRADVQVPSIVYLSDDIIAHSSTHDRHDIRVWNIAKEELIARLDGHTGDVMSLAHLPDSPDGAILASGSKDNTVRLWTGTGNGKNWRTSKRIGVHKGDITCLVYLPGSPDGATFASGDTDGKVHLWKWHGEKWQSEVLIDHAPRRLDNFNVESLAYNAKRETLASGSINWAGATKVFLSKWNGNRWQSEQLPGVDDITGILAYSPDGTLALGTKEGTVVLDEGGTTEELHHQSVSSLAYSPDGTTLASASVVRSKTSSSHGHLVLTDTNTLKSIELEGQASVTSVAYAPNGATLASGIRESRAVYVWDLAPSKDTKDLDANRFPKMVSDVALTTNATYFVFTPKFAKVTRFGDGEDADKGVDYGECRITLYFPKDSKFFLMPLQTLEAQRAAAVGKAQVDLGITVGTTLLGKVPVINWFVASFNIAASAFEYLEALEAFSETAAAEALGQAQIKLVPDSGQSAGYPDAQEIPLVVLIESQSGGKITSLEFTIEQEYQKGDNSYTSVARGQWNFKSAAPAAPGVKPMSLSDYPPFQSLPLEVQHYLLREFAEPRIAVAEMLRVPEETSLLPNYPNPFNPETWIPYQLAEPADVALTIYDIKGNVVRDIDLGHQRAGIYESKSRAAYWDGRNAQGERVASGVYFYTLKAGDFTATRKMLIQK